MMLIVIIILGVSASQMAINEERGARSTRDRQIAFQAAEAALKDAEYEILNPASPACAVPKQYGQGRAGTQICFNQSSGVYFVPGCASIPTSAQGLCAYNPASPAYLSSTVNFYADASGTAGGSGNTVRYGQFTGQVFPSQATSGLSNVAVSAYPPRYIIEVIPRNVAYDSCTSVTAGAGCKSMFRITAMGFGANPNSQVVLQSVVSTLN